MSVVLPSGRAPGSAESPVRDARRVALLLAVAVAFADSSIVVLALPDLLTVLDTTIPQVAWVITSYNVAVAVVTLVLARARGLDPLILTRIGLVLFCAASLGCAASGDLGILIAARTAQGVGGALLLCGTVPLMAAAPSGRGTALWGAAAVVGSAIGPAAGGALTEVFDWRAIFIAQVPLALVALAATVRLPPSAPREAVGPAEPRERRARLLAGISLGLVSAALTGALFLAVLLVIEGWSHSPLLAAGVVSILPAAALAAGPILRRSQPAAATVGGIVLLAAGLAVLALLPGQSLGLLCAALAFCGLGIGLAVPLLTAASLRGPDQAAAAGWSVGVRHAGLVLALALLAPLLAADLDHVDADARPAGAEMVIEAPLTLREKIDIARALEAAIDAAPTAQRPDLGPALAAGGDPRDPARVQLRNRLEALIGDTITRAFRNVFALCALFAVLALIPLVPLGRRGPG